MVFTSLKMCNSEEKKAMNATLGNALIEGAGRKKDQQVAKSPGPQALCMHFFCLLGV